MTPEASLAPWISLADATAAVDFYARAFGAHPREVLDDPDGRVQVAELAVGQATFWVQDDPEAAAEGHGRPIRLILMVDDPDALVERALGAGAVLVNPVTEEHGWRVGRLVDPFGVHWELGRRLG